MIWKVFWQVCGSQTNSLVRYDVWGLTAQTLREKDKQELSENIFH